MQKKDGSIIWVTGAGRFIRRADGSLEIYMGCYRDITAQQELEEHVNIIEAIGRVFNFSIFIDVSAGGGIMMKSGIFIPPPRASTQPRVITCQSGRHISINCPGWNIVHTS